MILGLRTVLYPVSDIDPAWTRLLGLGASPLEPVTEVGEGGKVASERVPQRTLRHKSGKRSFLVAFWASVLVNVTVMHLLLAVSN